MSYLDAAAVCCDAGMTLLSVESPYEHDCLAYLNNGRLIE